MDEAYLDSFEYGGLAGVVITRIDNAYGSRPTSLGSPDCRPKDTFTTTSSIT